ncbi:MAG: fluoride efflux transporter CrcB [Steroidobacteraceae bacterium]
MWKSILAVSIGGALGTLLRWQSGLLLNRFFPLIPPGTLAVNLVGGYIIGFAMGLFASMPNLAPEWRLLVITGFCGGLTTFSTFSSELVVLLRQGSVAWAGSHILVHVAASAIMTFLGLATVEWLKPMGGGA